MAEPPRIYWREKRAQKETGAVETYPVQEPGLWKGAARLHKAQPAPDGAAHQGRIPTPCWR